MEKNWHVIVKIKDRGGDVQDVDVMVTCTETRAEAEGLARQLAIETLHLEEHEEVIVGVAAKDYDLDARKAVVLYAPWQVIGMFNPEKFVTVN